eukprot:6093251-Pleurochrysis_carterae.AAC.2
MAGGGAVKIAPHTSGIYTSSYNPASRDVTTATQYKRQRWRSAAACRCVAQVTAVGVRSHLAATIANGAYTVIQSTCGAYVLNTRMSGGARASL